MPSLKSLTFESGSKLREIQAAAFMRCQSLKSFSLPASVSVIAGSAFLESSIEEILVDAANPNYFASGQFLIGVDGMTLIRYFGHAEDLGIDCLSDLGLRQIGRSAFSQCSTLKSICIPASIEILGDDCFGLCASLSQVTFESGSKLTQMGVNVFHRCSSLTSMWIPANVESIPKQCFFFCISLVEVTFESGSKLTRIEDLAFAHCQSLRSFAVPAQVEVMACGVFSGCSSLRELMFEIPSHLKELDLPPSEFGSLCIPDSVEVVYMWTGTHGPQRRLLDFGEKSCLKEISSKQPQDPWTRALGYKFKAYAFVRLPGIALRRFRYQFEGL
jgi:hypothetical protein